MADEPTAIERLQASVLELHTKIASMSHERLATKLGDFGIATDGIAVHFLEGAELSEELKELGLRSKSERVLSEVNSLLGDLFGALDPLFNTTGDRLVGPSSQWNNLQTNFTALFVPQHGASNATALEIITKPRLGGH